MHSLSVQLAKNTQKQKKVEGSKLYCANYFVHLCICTCMCIKSNKNNGNIIE